MKKLSDDSIWSKTPPTEQGWYWHWNGDSDSYPIPISVLWSGTTKSCFVCAGQLGLKHAIDCDVYGGLWACLVKPEETSALRAENDRLKRERDDARDCFIAESLQCVNLRAENERLKSRARDFQFKNADLRAERDELREEGQELAMAVCGLLEQSSENGAVGGSWKEAYRSARQLLDKHNKRPDRQSEEAVPFRSVNPFSVASQQPTPHGSGTPIVNLVKADLEARAQAGELKYGERLKAHNGRNALLDAYQEALDLACYLRQAMQETTERQVAPAATENPTQEKATV